MTRDDKADFVLKAAFPPQQRNDLALQNLGKLGQAKGIGLELYSDVATVQVKPPGSFLRDVINFRHRLVNQCDQNDRSTTPALIAEVLVIVPECLSLYKVISDFLRGSLNLVAHAKYFGLPFDSDRETACPVLGVFS